MAPVQSQMVPEGDNATAIDESGQQILTTSTGATATTSAPPPETSNDNDIKPSGVRFHPTVKEAVPPSRIDRFFQAFYGVMPTIPTSIQEGPTAMNPELHCNNLVKPGGQPRKEMPENFHHRPGRAGYGERMLARAMENLSSLPASFPSLPTGLPSMPSMPSMPWMPAMPSLSSLLYLGGPERRARRFSDRGYTTLLEPFEPVENPVDQTDESVGETIPADVAVGASTSALLEDGDDDKTKPELGSFSEDDEAYFCVYDDVETDVGYEARRHEAEAQRGQRQQYWDAARNARDTASTMVKAGAQMAFTGARVGAAVMATTAHDQLTDIVRDLGVRGARNRLLGSQTAGNELAEPPLEGGDDGDRPQPSTVSAHLDELGDSDRSEHCKSSDDDDDNDDNCAVEDQEEGVVTEGLTVVGGVQPIQSPYDQKQQKKIDASEDRITDTADNAAHKATACLANKDTSKPGPTAFDDVDLSHSEFIHPARLDDNDDDDFDVITEEEAGRPRYSLDDVSPHTRRPLNIAHGRGRPEIAARPPVRPAGFQRPPSPGRMSIAMVSERVSELPHRRRLSRGNSNSEQQN
ncbi:hypothetical protein UCDDS831_g04284 [Diplodia seriata]|uniref:Uncharacterized protein n=1 Tax=Diplodia seriata TaxID=420778 RepID=A0A0G2EG28_9PEZI|nr:hypothetical protein UCDDS831_g04284 [Diplodia seriata]